MPAPSRSCMPRSSAWDVTLNEQQAGVANFFPRGRTQEDLEFLCGAWKGDFRLSEKGVGMWRVIVRRGSSNQIVKPLSLWIGERDSLIAAVSRQNESRSSSCRLTNWFATEPYEPAFCLRVILSYSFLEKTAHPDGRDLSFWHGMIEPSTDIESEAAPFQVIEDRPA